MEILGVLLGITMSLLASAIAVLAWYLKREYRFLRNLNHATELVDYRVKVVESQLDDDNQRWERAEERIFNLENSKASTTTATAPASEPPRVRWRTWNEDAVMPEKSN